MACIFCEIVEKKRPAKLIYEDEFAVAFEDINPQAPVHALVVPKKHIPTSLDIDEGDKALIGHLFRIANRIADGPRRYQRTNSPSGLQQG